MAGQGTDVTAIAESHGDVTGIAESYVNDSAAAGVSRA
jgi:hypothetical protein